MKTYAEFNSTKGATYNYEESRQTFESAVKYALHTNTQYTPYDVYGMAIRDD